MDTACPNGNSETVDVEMEDATNIDENKENVAQLSNAGVGNANAQHFEAGDRDESLLQEVQADPEVESEQIEEAKQPSVAGIISGKAKAAETGSESKLAEEAVSSSKARSASDMGMETEQIEQADQPTVAEIIAGKENAAETVSKSKRKRQVKDEERFRQEVFDNEQGDPDIDVETEQHGDAEQPTSASDENADEIFSDYDSTEAVFSLTADKRMEENTDQINNLGAEDEDADQKMFKHYVGLDESFIKEVTAIAESMDGSDFVFNKKIHKIFNNMLIIYMPNADCFGIVINQPKPKFFNRLNADKVCWAQELRMADKLLSFVKFRLIDPRSMPGFIVVEPHGPFKLSLEESERLIEEVRAMEMEERDSIIYHDEDVTMLTGPNYEMYLKHLFVSLNLRAFKITDCVQIVERLAKHKVNKLFWLRRPTYVYIFRRLQVDMGVLYGLQVDRLSNTQFQKMAMMLRKGLDSIYNNIRLLFDLYEDPDDDFWMAFCEQAKVYKFYVEKRHKKQWNYEPTEEEEL